MKVVLELRKLRKDKSRDEIKRRKTRGRKRIKPKGKKCN